MRLDSLAKRELLLVCAFVTLLSPGLLFAQTDSTAEKQAALEQELADINQEIAGLSNTISTLSTESASLDRDIRLLNATIDRANLNIKAKNLQISRLGAGILEKSKTVRELGKRIDREKQSLAQLIRKTNEIDQAGALEVLLSGKDLSDFFLDLDSFDAIRAGLKNSSEALKSAKLENQAAQEALEERQAQEMDAKAELERNKRLVEANEKRALRRYAPRFLRSVTRVRSRSDRRMIMRSPFRRRPAFAPLFSLRSFSRNQASARIRGHVISRIRRPVPASAYGPETSFSR